MKVEVDLDKFGHMRVTLPGKRPHSVFLPMSLAGLITLHHILKQREEVPEEKRTIGTEACPTQAMVTAFLETHQVKTVQSVRAKPAPVIPELDFSALKL